MASIIVGRVVTGSDGRLQLDSDPVKIAAGERIARRACGECHAVGPGPSPFSDAPPFRDLHRRHPPGGLAQLLKEGMLPSDKPQEEGSSPRHPEYPWPGWRWTRSPT